MTEVLVYFYHCSILRSLLARGLMLLAVLGISCKRSGPNDETPLAELEKQIGYRPGAWWRDADKLNDLVLAGAQIVITHGRADAEESKRLFLTPRPERTREQALRLALEIKAQLRDAPEKFAELAQRHSDDSRTVSRGGELGAFHAPASPSRVIDAFGNTKKGDISRVVESEVGFYLIRRSEVPAAQQVSARHVLIKYEGAFGWTGIGRPLKRSRVDAQQLARRVALEARKNPQAFSDVIKKYSDGFDAASAGDFGSWSTHDNADSVLLSTIAALKVGEVSGATEGVEGFHIFQRTRLTERTLLSSSHLVVSYAGAAEAAYRAPVKRGREEARALAQQSLQELRVHPERFDDLRREHCDVPWFCAEPRTAALGRGTPRIDEALEAVPVGGIVDAVLETPIGFHLVRREDANEFPLPKVAIAFEFSRPPPADLNWVLTNASPEQLSTESKKLAREASAALKLEGDEARYVSQIFARFSERIAQIPAPERIELARGVQNELKGVLGASRWQSFERFLAAWLEQQQGF